MTDASRTAPAGGWGRSRPTSAPPTAQGEDLVQLPHPGLATGDRAAGFPLIGGRIDVIGTTPLPTLLCGRRKHVITLPAVQDPDEDSARRPAGQGDNVVTGGRIRPAI